MVETVEIYGIKIKLPERFKVHKRSEYKRDQKFERIEFPDSFYSIEFAEDGVALYSEEQVQYITDEYEKMKHGYWFYNNGVPTYITGIHYFYLNYWTLEDGSRPDYRDADRRWFIYREHCESLPYCFGVIRIKKRREGATSQEACALVYKAIMKPKSNCGIVSKTGNPDARDVFQKMVVWGYKNLPVFLKPSVEDETSKTSLVFSPPKRKTKSNTRTKGQVFDDDMGLESVIDYRSTALNSYDSGRVTAILIDEGGKWPKDVPINKYWPIVRKTLTKGMIKVGFAVIPSTVNDSENGGNEFKELFDGSYASETSKFTATGLYQYFCPAYDGYEGFIDEYGMSIIEKPTKEQQQYIKEKFGIEIEVGAKDFLMQQRTLIKDPTALSEEVRMNPFSVEEAFKIDAKKCYFDSEMIYEQLNILSVEPVRKRRGRFLWKDGVKGGDVVFSDATDGEWSVIELPDVSNLSQHGDRGRMPGNTPVYVMGVDPFRNSIVNSKYGSMGSAWMMKKFNAADPENTGLPVAHYYGRPRLKTLFDEEMLKAAIYYGCKIVYEMDASDDIVRTAMELKLLNYLSKTPDSAIKPGKEGQKNKEWGVKSSDPYAMGQQLELAIQYTNSHIHKLYYEELLEEMLVYDHMNRTEYDRTVSFMISLLGMMGHRTKQESMVKTLPIQTFKLKL
jgi:hypothetical protein